MHIIADVDGHSAVDLTSAAVVGDDISSTIYDIGQAHTTTVDVTDHCTIENIDSGGVVGVGIDSAESRAAIDVTVDNGKAVP